MNLKLRGVISISGGILLCLMVSGQCEAQINQKGSKMLSFLFGKKPEPSKVAPEVGATLQRQSALPKQLSPSAKPSFPECRTKHIRGTPPNVRWVADEVQGETRHVFVIPGTGTTPSLAVLSHRDDRSQKLIQMWELSAEKPARFVRQRPVVLPKELATSTWTFPVTVVCLPEQQVAMSVGYENPAPRDALLIYDSSKNMFSHVDRIEPEFTGTLPLKYLETIYPTPDSMLLLYHTKAIRLGMDDYVYENDHILLFSPRFSHGLEIVRLSIGDGNVRAWGMQGKTLWLQTLDRRKRPQEFLWSLDLTKVL